MLDAFGKVENLWPGEVPAAVPVDRDVLIALSLPARGRLNKGRVSMTGARDSAFRSVFLDGTGLISSC